MRARPSHARRAGAGGLEQTKSHFSKAAAARGERSPAAPRARAKSHADSIAFGSEQSPGAAPCPAAGSSRGRCQFECGDGDTGGGLSAGRARQSVRGSFIFSQIPPLRWNLREK